MLGNSTFSNGELEAGETAVVKQYDNEPQLGSLPSLTNLSDLNHHFAVIENNSNTFWPGNSLSGKGAKLFQETGELETSIAATRASEQCYSDNGLQNDDRIRNYGFQSLNSRSDVNDCYSSGTRDESQGLITEPAKHSVEDTAADFLTCSSPTLHDDRGEPKLELPMSERSISAEFDSGMGTDKSVGSLSPIRYEVDPEKDLWSESSQYASAEGSPCESLIGISDVQDLIVHGVPPSEMRMAEKADSSDTQDGMISEQVGNDEAKPQLSEEDDSQCEADKNEKLLLQSQNNTNVAVEGNGLSVGSKNVEEDDHMSEDRLVEFVENRIERLELQLSDRERHVAETEKNEQLNTNGSICSEINQVASDVDLTTDSKSGSLKLSEEITFKDTSESEKNDTTEGVRHCDLQNSITREKCLKHELGTEVSKTPTTGIHNIFDCTFSISELSVNTIGTDEIVNEEEPERAKRKLTVSWDPVPLLHHLYDLKLESFSEQQVKHKPYDECYVNVESFGAFEDKSGKYYTFIEENCLHFYESDEKEKCALQVPLQYATMEVTDNNTLVLDNKLGKCIHMKFGNEDEMLSKKASIQCNCKRQFPLSCLEIVHYPLKSHKDVIIIDLGSCSTRAGILMDQPTLPKLFFPTVCATDKRTGIKQYGMSALMPDVRRNSVLSFPVRQSAKVTKFTMDIDALTGLFKYIFSELNVDPKNYTVQVCIPRSLSTSTQIALMKLLLEDLCVNSVSLTRQALLTLYANNISTAIVVDIGDRMEVLPVVDGFILEGGVTRLPYGGQRMIHHMKHALAQKHISLSNDVESFLVQYIFENICYVAENYEEELALAVENAKVVRKSIPLHDFLKDETKLQTVWLDIGRFQVPEGLFQPDLWGLDSLGLHKLVHQAIQISGMDARRQMAESIYVSGGITLLPGFVERLEKEIAKLTLPRLKPKVHASPYRYHMTYIGACQLASSEQFHQVCISTKEWNKSGPAGLNKWHL